MALKLNHVVIDFTNQAGVTITRTQVINLASLIPVLDGTSDIRGTATTYDFTDTDFLTALTALNTKFPNFIINRVQRPE